jgi:hypothetical protein
MLARCASFAVASFLLPLTVAAAPLCKAASGAQTAALLELYTSEGCSSCPPADQWVSGLTASGFTADKVIPLAFHVDYWDYIGWKDRYASPTYTQRQHELADIARARTVYTPQVILNGKDFRASSSRLADAAKTINGLPARAQIQIGLAERAPREWQISSDISVPDASQQRDAAMYLALYENRLTSDVRAGENSGVLLKHDYVVREWVGPLALDGGKLSLNRNINLKPEQKTRDSGLVAIVQNRRTGEVLQALQLPYCGER